MGEADLEDLLLVEPVGELHEYKDVVMFCLGNHILPHYFDQRLHFKEFDDGVIVDKLTPRNLDRETVEAF